MAALTIKQPALLPLAYRCLLVDKQRGKKSNDNTDSSSQWPVVTRRLFAAHLRQTTKQQAALSGCTGSHSGCSDHPTVDTPVLRDTAVTHSHTLSHTVGRRHCDFCGCHTHCCTTPHTMALPHTLLYYQTQCCTTPTHHRHYPTRLVGFQSIFQGAGAAAALHSAATMPIFEVLLL